MAWGQEAYAWHRTGELADSGIRHFLVKARRAVANIFLVSKGVKACYQNARKKFLSERASVFKKGPY